MTTRLSHQLVALTLALLMPLCCCQLQMAGAMVFEPAADQATSIEHGCCPNCVTTDRPSDSDDGDDNGSGCCSCCLKFAGGSADWSPPVDTIGTDLPTWSLPLDDTLPSASMIDTALPLFDLAHHPPPPALTLVSLRCALLI